MKPFTKFQTVAPIADQTLDALEGGVPDEILGLWRSHGAGYIGDGFLRLVDPAIVTGWLPSFIADPHDLVPIFTSALADVVVWRDGYFFIANTRLALAHPLSFSRPAHVLRFSEDPTLLDKDFRWANYAPGAARLGVPDMSECLYYAPLLSLGGAETPEALRRGGLAAHLEIAAQLQGKITIGSL